MTTTSEIKKNRFGEIDGQEVTLYTLSNGQKMIVEILNYGCIIKSICVPNKYGELRDVALGFDSLEEYVKDGNCLGAAIGRFANRIADGKFTLDGVDYQLPKNLGHHHLHGGPEGFNKIIWNAEVIENEKGQTLELTHTSPDGHMGYPGNLKCTIKYTLSNDNSLSIEYLATTDKPTIVNFTNHSYFNLKDGGQTSVLSHELMIDSDQITEADDENIPTGDFTDIKDSAFDFNIKKRIGDQINKDPKLVNGGYDHNYVLKSAGELKKIAEVYEETSGVKMEIRTTSPGVQLFTAGNLEGSMGKIGLVYGKFPALCLETQNFPDAPNHEHFPRCFLRSGEIYVERTVYKF